MNILILFSQPWRVGGAETHVEALIQGLTTEKVIMAVNRGSDQQKLQRLQQTYSNLQIIEIQARGIHIVQWVLDLFRLARVIKENNIEIVSAQQRTAGIWAHLLHYFCGTPFVVTMHDSWHRALGKKLYAKLFPQMIVVSQNLTNILTQTFGFQPTQIEFINNGIDFTTFLPQDKAVARQRLGIAVTDKIMLHVSRLSSIKGAVSLTLIDSMPHVVKQEPNMKLMIIGEGPLRTEIEAKAKAINDNYKNCITVQNFTDAIVDWYNAADIIVGEGRVAIEALACQRPVVAIRNSNWFFGCVTPDNIAAAMEVNFDGTLFPADPELVAVEIKKALQLEASQTVEIAQCIYQNLSIEEMAGKYHDVFMKLTRGEKYEKNTDY